MRTWRLVLAYDGGAFQGWQIQPRGRTVQGELERALEVIYREPLRVAAAGRTDAGVHALGQVASFRSEDERYDAARLRGSLRGLLPEDVTLVEAAEAHADFHARFSALSRHYEYRIGLAPVAPFRGLRWEPGWKLDPSAMAAALPALREATDFRAFCRAEAAEKGSECRILELDLRQEGDELRLRIGADRFLHNMVRIVMGTLVEIGRGRWPAERMAEIVASRERGMAGPTAPPQGLYLRRVGYPEELLRP